RNRDEGSHLGGNDAQQYTPDAWIFRIKPELQGCRFKGRLRDRRFTGTRIRWLTILLGGGAAPVLRSALGRWLHYFLHDLSQLERLFSRRGASIRNPQRASIRTSSQGKRWRYRRQGRKHRR